MLRRLGMAPKEAGTAPLSLLRERSRCSSWEALPMEAGRLPFSALPGITRMLSRLPAGMTSGIAPVSMLLPACTAAAHDTRSVQVATMRSCFGADTVSMGCLRQPYALKCW